MATSSNEGGCSRVRESDGGDACPSIDKYATGVHHADGTSSPTCVGNASAIQHTNGSASELSTRKSSTINDEGSCSHPVRAGGANGLAAPFILADAPSCTVSTSPLASYGFAESLLSSGKITQEDYEKLTKLIEQDIIGTSDGRDRKVVEFATHGAVKIVAKVPLPTRRCAEAAAEVLGTAELLESILLGVPELDLICNAPLVCRGFREAIEGSAAIKRRIWRLPSQEVGPPSSLVIMNTVEGFGGLQFWGSGHLSEMIVRVSTQWISESAYNSNVLRDTQINRPAMKRAVLEHADFEFDGHGIRELRVQMKYEFHSQGGITFGTLMDLIDTIDARFSTAESLSDHTPLPDWLCDTDSKARCVDLYLICTPECDDQRLDRAMECWIRGEEQLQLRFACE